MKFFAYIWSSEFEFLFLYRRSWGSRRHDVRILRVRHNGSRRAGSARKLPCGSAGQGRHTWTPHRRRIRLSRSNKRQLRARAKPPHKACIFWMNYVALHCMLNQAFLGNGNGWIPVVRPHSLAISCLLLTTTAKHTSSADMGHSRKQTSGSFEISVLSRLTWYAIF